MKRLWFHPAVAKELKKLDVLTRDQLAKLFAALATGVSLGMPVSRPLLVVEHGAHELRVRDATGEIRTFYFTKHAEAILVFHMFRKKTQKTPDRELAVARQRLRSML